MANFEKGIGLNSDRLHRNIKEFKSAVDDVRSKIKEAGRVLFDGLKEKWASPDAHVKSRDWNDLLCTVMINLEGDQAVTIDKVEDAAELVAKSLGASYKRVSDDIGMNYSWGKSDSGSFYGGWPTCLEAFPDGTVAMDVDSVKVILDLFNRNIEEVYTLMDAVPDRINIYDMNGDIQTGFSCRIKELKEKLVEGVKTVNTELKSYMDQYIADLMSAKAKAESAIQDNFSNPGTGVVKSN